MELKQLISLEKKRKNQVDHIPIIAITAYALKGDKEKFLSKGMDEYISKPIDINELSEILNKIQNNIRNNDTNIIKSYLKSNKNYSKNDFIEPTKEIKRIY